jgi:hypothetical protein
LLLVGAAAVVTREWEALIYNNDGQCGPTPGLSRSARCGTNRDIGMATETIADVALVGAGIAAAASGLLFVMGSGRLAPKAGIVACGLDGPGMACGVRF